MIGKSSAALTRLPIVTSSLENRLRFKHLTLLRHLDAEGSLHKAAAKLHMSQPAASKLLREMESLFGGVLFTRSSSGLTPTPSGRMLLEHTEAVMTEIALAQSEVAAGIVENPIVRVGAIAIAIQIELLPVLVRFNDVRPKGQVRIFVDRTVPLLELLRKGQIDLAIGMVSAFTVGDDMLRGVSHQVLQQEEWVVIANRTHRLARKRKIDLEELAQCRWALQPKESLIRTAFDQAYHVHGHMPPQPFVEALSFTTNLSVVRSANVVTIAPRSAVQSPENADSFVALKTDLKFVVPPLAIFYKAGTLKRSPVRTLFDLLTSPSSRQPT